MFSKRYFIELNSPQALKEAVGPLYMPRSPIPVCLLQYYVKNYLRDMRRSRKLSDDD